MQIIVYVTNNGKVTQFNFSSLAEANAWVENKYPNYRSQNLVNSMYKVDICEELTQNTENGDVITITSCIPYYP